MILSRHRSRLEAIRIMSKNGFIAGNTTGQPVRLEQNVGMKIPEVPLSLHSVFCLIDGVFPRGIDVASLPAMPAKVWRPRPDLTGLARCSLHNSQPSSTCLPVGFFLFIKIERHADIYM